ncbi:MAG: MTH1187 family thiamine-binding protein [Elusimicrobiota bacterium]
MPLMEISIIPLGTKSPSVSKYVADALKILEEYKGIKYELSSMGTVIESGSLDILFDIAEKMHNRVLGSDVKRVVTSIKIDDRTDKKISIKSKKNSVQEKKNE